MKPENVKPAKFHLHTVIYNNEGFSVAYGKWENSETRLAMRWDGEGDDEIGYPSQGGNPLWFQLPNHGIWTSEILHSIDRIYEHEKRIEDLNSRI